MWYEIEQSGIPTVAEILSSAKTIDELNCLHSLNIPCFHMADCLYISTEGCYFSRKKVPIQHIIELRDLEHLKLIYEFFETKFCQKYFVDQGLYDEIKFKDQETIDYYKLSTM